MDGNPDMKKTILAQMKLPESFRDYLEGVKTPLLKEWCYLGMAFGFPLEKIRTLHELAGRSSGNPGPVFLEERERFFREKYETDRELGQQVTELKAEVGSMYERSSFLAGLLDDTLKRSLEEKDRLYREMLAAKDRMISDRDSLIRELKEEAAALKEEAARLRKERQELIEKAAGQGREKAGPKEGASMVRQQADRAVDPVRPEGRQDQEACHDPRSRPACRLRKKHGFLRKKDRSAEDFIKRYIENDDYRPEQREFLIRCLEAGDTLKEIRRFASPSLSVSHMERLRQITTGGRRS